MDERMVSLIFSLSIADVVRALCSDSQLFVHQTRLSTEY
jgi:hypothetical protein